MKKTALIVLMIIIVLLVGYQKVRTSVPYVAKKPPGVTSKTQTVVATSPYSYPISNYLSRLTVRGFGQLVKPGDEKALACGSPFSGYHTGDDLETTMSEANALVPVKAIADGVVREAAYVSGYGGLVVIQHNLNGLVVTAYYGHLNIASVKYKVGDTIKDGAVIGDLGEGCTQQTDYERKHLHFAIHLGTAIDVRGYVPTLVALSAWIDPEKELSSLKAVQ